MAKDLLKYFDDLKKLPIDYSNSDFQDYYKKAITLHLFEDALGYESLRKDPFVLSQQGYVCPFYGIFHLVLNVKVSSNSPFLPFAFVTNSNSTKKSMAKEIIENNQEKIRYNFTQLLDDLTGIIDISKFIESVDFRVSLCEEEIIVDNYRINGTPIISANKAKSIGHLFASILSKEGNFITILSEAYSQSGAWRSDYLYFSIFSFDQDIQSGNKLTQLLIISENINEAEFFNQVGVGTLRDIVSIIRTRYVYDIAEKNRFESIKSAKSAIMSRNMSHNLGSHVMAYLKQKLSSVTTILDAENKVLTDLLPDHIDLTKVQNVELPFLVGLGRFIGYLQERQDYIATISTDYIPYGAPVNLKDAIYDELNPDLRFLRHKVNPNDPSGSTNDASNRPANILLNYIAASENLSRENMGDNFASEKDIRFGFVKYYEAGAPNLFRTETFGFTSFSSDNAVLKNYRKVSFSLPGGLVGRQAVFSIVENLIRNAAKHGKTSEVKNLDFTLDVIDGSEVCESKCLAWEYRVATPHWRELYEKASDINDVFILTITDNLITPSGVAEDLRDGLYEDYVDMSTGKMTTANKGIKEMRISAAWLRSDTNEDHYLRFDGKGCGGKAPLVGVELSHEGHLRYMFCIRKSKTVAIIPEIVLNKGSKGEMRYEMGKETRSLFNKLHDADRDCWNILTWEDFLKSKSSFSFILIPDDLTLYNALRPLTSNRLLRWKETDDNKAALESSGTALIKVYQEFTGLNRESEKIYIDDGKAAHELQIRNGSMGKEPFERIVLGGADFSKNSKVYLYKTHLATSSMYIKFANSEHYGEHACVEAITGDNSSDRLIRREPLNEIWYYNHLYALKNSVAIIDERIFKLIHCIDERTFVDHDDEGISIDSLFSIIKEQNCDEHEILTNIKDNWKVFQLSKADSKKLLFSKNLEDIKTVISSVPRSIIADITHAEKKDKTVIGFSHLTPYYQGKGVHVFTVTRGANGRMILVGCINSSFNEDKFINSFAKIGDFVKGDNGDISLIPVPEYASILEGMFDYISIHQGILDKIYEDVGVKKNSQLKCEVTKGIHRCMIRGKDAIGEFLPGLIIHSGRAKPTVEDMPQKQPFIQYAAIENAVKDCKPMLVELLDFAKFE